MPAGLGVPELLIIFLILVMIFGLGKLPELGKSVGKSIRDFRSAFKDEDDGIDDKQARNRENKYER